MSYRDIFEARGHLYNDAHVIASDARDAEAAHLIQWLEPCPGQTIVVTAAGGGYDACRIADFLLPEAAEIICVEPSQRFSSRIPDAFRVINAALDEIPLPDGCADAVVNLAALHHCKDRDELFDEWDRLLKPRGRMVIADVDAGPANGTFLNSVVAEFTPGGHDGIFLLPGQLSDEFGKRDYQGIEERLERYEWDFRSRDEMIRFSRSLFGMLEATDQQIATGIEQHLGVLEPGANAPVAYPWSLRFFRAFKP